MGTTDAGTTDRGMSAVGTTEPMGHVIRPWQTLRSKVWSPLEVDALLYGASALFAVLTVELSSFSLYRQWGLVAIGPYAAATALSLVLWLLERRRQAQLGTQLGTPQRRLWLGRMVVFSVALLGATLLPLALQAAWRSNGSTGHVQPEVQVIERAAHRLTEGHDPYQVIVRHGKVVLPTNGQPSYELFFPYLPLMTVFGLPASAPGGDGFTEGRIFFTAATLALAGGALAVTKGPQERRFRSLQVITVLPVAALPLATGGDDLPIVAFLLLAMVLAQRRQPVWSGLVLGVVSAMKFTAWPLAALALFAARDRDGRRAPGKMLLGLLVVVVPAVTPFVFLNVTAFVQNVVLFPLGSAGVKSPAASPLPGRLLVTASPTLGHVVIGLVALAGAAFLVYRLVRSPPRTPAEVTAIAGTVMTVAILIAPTTRIGYLLYPINFFVWSWMLRGDEEAVSLEATVRSYRKAGSAQSGNGLTEPPSSHYRKRTWSVRR